MEVRPAMGKRGHPASIGQMPSAIDNGDGYIDLTRVAAAVRRQLPIVMRCAVAGFILGILYVLIAVPRYQAVETLLIDEDRAELLDEVSPMPHAVVSDSAIQGEVEIIKSQVLALRVVDQLQLVDDPDFMNPPALPFAESKEAMTSWARSILDRISPFQPSMPEGADDGGDELSRSARFQAAQILRSNLEVERIGRSFVINVKYLGFSPVRTTRIARAFGDAYKGFQLRAGFEVARESGDWLAQRLKQLEQQSVEVAQGLEKFRLDHELVSVKGDLLSDQQLSETLTKLIEAEADTAQAKARLDEFERLLANGEGEAMATATFSTDTPNDDVIAKLKIELSATSARYRDVERRWDSNHPEAVRLSDRLDEIEQSLLSEMRQVTNALKAEYEIALSRQASLQSSLDTITLASSRAIGLVGKLRHLEEEAAIYRAVYQEFLKRYEMARQQQEFPVASVETISLATVPKRATYPRKTANILLGILLGGLIGACIGTFREVRDQPIRTRNDIQRHLEMRLIGTVGRDNDSGEGAVSRRQFLRTSNVMRARADAILRRDAARSIGISPILAAPSSNFAERFAEHLATQGARVLFVEIFGDYSEDSDDRASDSPEITARAGGHGISRHAPASPETGHDILRLNVLQYRSDQGKSGGRPVDLVKDVLTEASGNYEYIILDLPPLSAGTIANDVSQNLDLAVLALAWGCVYPGDIEAALQENQAFAERVDGVLLVDTDFRVLKRYVQSGTYEAVSLGMT